MSEMSEIDQVHLRAVMLFMSETSEIIIIFNIHKIWWKSPKSELSKTFFWLKIRWRLRKLWAKMSLTTTMQQCYSCLMSETSEMWNISIKDQRQHCTKQCYSCRRHRRSLNYIVIIIQTIQIKKYFELMLRITWNFELKPCIYSN